MLRDGAKFHNGDPVTVEDVKFTFDRYRGTSHELMRQRVAAVEIQDARHISFRLAEPWPDFLTFYATTTGAGWIVPKKHIEKVGEEAFKKAPVGAGPYKFISFKPGLELVLEAFDGYWRKTPAVKRLTLRVIPDEATRLAALKNGEVDIVYSVRGELAQELERTPGLVLKPASRPRRIQPIFRRSVGPEIAVARSARPSRGQSGDRPPTHQRCLDARLLAGQRQPDRAVALRIFLAAAAAGL